jgi:hypothetical protein
MLRIGCKMPTNLRIDFRIFGIEINIAWFKIGHEDE